MRSFWGLRGVGLSVGVEVGAKVGVGPGVGVKVGADVGVSVEVGVGSDAVQAAMSNNPTERANSQYRIRIMPAFYITPLLRVQKV